MLHGRVGFPKTVPRDFPGGRSVLRLAIILLLVALCVMQFSACSDEAPTPDQSGNGQTGGETGGKTGGDNDTETPASKLTFVLNEDGQSYTVTGLSDKTLTKLTIPSTYQGFPVTSIGWYAFEDCTSLTSIQYNGTKEQWKAIEKSYRWSSDTGEFIVHCSDGDIN